MADKRLRIILQTETLADDGEWVEDIVVYDRYGLMPNGSDVGHEMHKGVKATQSHLDRHWPENDTSRVIVGPRPLELVRRGNG